MNRSDVRRVTLEAAIGTTAIDSHRYLANVPLDHCYGRVSTGESEESPQQVAGPTAHGGLLVSIIQSATQRHFRSTLRSYSQPDTFNIETVFVRPATAGDTTVIIKDVKVGAKISTVHFALVQDDKERVLGYASNTDLGAAVGISHPTPTILAPPPISVDLARLATHGVDAGWVGFTIPWHLASFIKPVTHFHFFVPAAESPHPNVTDVWMRFHSRHERFTTEMLGSVADHWHRMLENYRPRSAWHHERLRASALQAAAEEIPIVGYSTSYSYPTLSMHLEIKRPLPPQGAEWLFVRAHANEIRNGRFDANITIMDEKLELVALSHQVCLVVEGLQVADVQKVPRGGKL